MARMDRALIRTFRAACVLLLFVSAADAYLKGQQAATAPVAQAEPGFVVAVTYSQKAKDTLTTSKETVIVAGYLTCFPKPGTPKKLIAQGEVGLGQVQKEVAPGQDATFGPVKLDPTGLKWADAQGPQLLINVYSGRKSSPNNLLDCGIYDGPLKDVQGKSIPISCKLIGE
jgi:hypothetical protein